MTEVESDNSFEPFGDNSNTKQDSGSEDALFFTPNESGDSSAFIKQSSNVASGMPNEMDALSSSQMYESMNSVVASEHNREDITQAAHQLIDDLNSKRKQDTQLLEDFKKALELQVQKTCSMVENQMSELYEKQGKVIEDKIQELFSCLDRITKIEVELQEFKQALQILYQDMNTS